MGRRTEQPTEQPNNRPTNQSTNRPTNQPTNQPTNKPTNQPNKLIISMAQVSPRIFIQVVKEFPILMELDSHFLSSQDLEFARHVALFLQQISAISRNQSLRVQSGYTIPANYRYHIAKCRWREEGDKFHRSKGIKVLPPYPNVS
jgi:hypothetical protein